MESNRFIVKRYGVLGDYVLNPYFENSDLNQYIERNKADKTSAMADSDVFRIVHNLVTALKEMHDKGYVNKNIHTSSVFLSSGEEEYLMDVDYAVPISHSTHKCDCYDSDMKNGYNFQTHQFPPLLYPFIFFISIFILLFNLI
jgi:serine/threonine protein kinase